MRKNTLVLICLVLFLSLSAISQLTVGYYDNAPKIYQDKLTSKATGFWADITNEIGKDANIEINWVFGTWAENIDRFNSGKIDVIFDVAEVDSRKETMLFSQETVILSWSTIYTNNKTNVSSLLDFQNHTIGVLSGSVNYDFEGGVVDLFKGFDINVEYVEFDSYKELLEAVSQGLIYGGVTSKDIGNMYFNQGKVNSTPFWFQPNQLNYALSKGNPQAEKIISILDEHIAKYKQDKNSVYYQALSKHFSQQTTNYFPKWIKLLLVFLFILIIIFYLFNRILSIKVKTQTEYLLHEIAEKESIQQKLVVAINKQEGINNIKDNFLRSVSHELLTPLNSILGFSDILLTNKEGVNSELGNEYLTKIHNSGTNLAKIVINMIDATLINSNLITLRNDEINIYDSITRLFKNFPKSDKLKYFLDIPEDCDKSLTITTDYDKLSKIFIHLLDNATKFTENGDITLGYNIEQENITYFIKDSGIGISENDKDIIFQGFTQLQNNKDRLYDGSGLGLAIVYALVTSLQGKIWVESSLTLGSTFYIKLPLKINIIVENQTN